MERPDAVRHFIFVFSDSAHLREGFRNYSVPTRHNCDCDGRCNPTAARTTVDVPEDPSTVGAEEVVSPCQSRLAEIAAFKPLPPITGLGDCTATDVVELAAVLLPNNHRVNFSPTAILRCPMAGAVAHWVRNDVAPTITTLGKSLRGVVTLDSYDCRLRNGVANAKIGEHGHANALDVRAFKFANGAAIELTDANVAKSLREKLQQCLCSFFDRTG